VAKKPLPFEPHISWQAFEQPEEKTFSITCWCSAIDNVIDRAEKLR
jgi:hypothetical protein